MVGENRRVQHLIREALDAKESVELQAAIMAAEKYAAKSKLDCDLCTGKQLQRCRGRHLILTLRLSLIFSVQ